MGKNSNAVKSKQLGMSHGAAAHHLRKQIMFGLLNELKRTNCFRCGKVIINVSELSIDHKVPWLHSTDPIKLFFDPANIAFSHLKCNKTDRPKGPNKKHPPPGLWWCCNCQAFRPISRFSRTKHRYRRTHASECYDCRNKRKKEWRKRRRAQGLKPS